MAVILFLVSRQKFSFYKVVKDHSFKKRKENTIDEIKRETEKEVVSKVFVNLLA